MADRHLAPLAEAGITHVGPVMHPNGKYYIYSNRSFTHDPPQSIDDFEVGEKTGVNGEVEKYFHFDATHSNNVSAPLKSLVDRVGGSSLKLNYSPKYTSQNNIPLLFSEFGEGSGDEQNPLLQPISVNGNRDAISDDVAVGSGIESECQMITDSVPQGLLARLTAWVASLRNSKNGPVTAPASGKTASMHPLPQRLIRPTEQSDSLLSCIDGANGETHTCDIQNSAGERNVALERQYIAGKDPLSLKRRTFWGREFHDFDSFRNISGDYGSGAGGHYVPINVSELMPEPALPSPQKTANRTSQSVESGSEIEIALFYERA
ncbi:unnamed protein product [Protopolystoma xenopodis]|uniref:Uncharacterized protein n=1 Tax=Protopolystoma xenopodis TaxID=117903 RepID=A0A3S4ZQG4_9PLAT|nr:unnamed protein product [Protopolystoma xenopodis]